MIGVKKMTEGFRTVGPSYGMPVTFVELDAYGQEYQPNDLVREILFFANTRWVCIFGGNPVQTGMGTLVKGLHAVRLYTEMEASASCVTPSWMSAIDRWDITFEEDGPFNLTALRNYDALRFDVDVLEDLDKISTYLGSEEIKLFPGVKYLRPSLSFVKVKSNILEMHRFTRQYDKFRVYTNFKDPFSV